MAEEIVEQIVEKMSEQELKGMKLHDEIGLGAGIFIRRVIGGWIYWRTYQQELKTNESSSISCAVAGVFVPENVSSPASIS